MIISHLFLTFFFVAAGSSFGAFSSSSNAFLNHDFMLLKRDLSCYFFSI